MSHIEFIKQYDFSVPTVGETEAPPAAMTPVEQLPDEVSYLPPSEGDKAGELFEKMTDADAFSQADWTQLDKNVVIEVHDYEQDDVQADVLVLDYSTNEPYDSAEKQTSQDLPASAVDEPAANNTEKFKVTLAASPGYMGKTEVVVLDVMPTISESRQTTYSDFTPMHHPGQIQKYQSTQSRSWTVTAKLISRSSREASVNLEILNIIRSWAMPFYGQGTAQDASHAKYLGAPPPIITLSAYGDAMIGPVKTVMTQYSWDFPNDVDYIPTLNSEPFPVLIQLSLSLTETWSPAEYSGFNLNAYKRGDMYEAFRPIARAERPLPKQQAQGITPSSAAVAEPTVVNQPPPARLKVPQSAADVKATAAENFKSGGLPGTDASDFSGVY